MKQVLIIIFFAFTFSYCNSQHNNKTTNSTVSAPKFINQLFIGNEIANEPKFCDAEPFIDGGLHGGLSLTQKGHIIINLANEESDTVRIQYGDYKLTDTTLTYVLTDEYYYPGRWDARWDVPDPDYKKGKTRKLNSNRTILNRPKCDSLYYYYPYTEHEKTEASKRIKSVKPYGLLFFPYYETSNMKFYSWLYTQIPVLAVL